MVKNKRSLSGNSFTEELEQLVLPHRVQRIEQVAKARTYCLTVVLDNVKNAHNISAVMRSADAFGVQTLHLVGDEFAFSRDISLGAERWLDIRTYDHAQPVIDLLKCEQFKIVVLKAPGPTSSSVPSIPVHQIPFKEKTALVFGNELDGVSTAFEKAADFSAYIPMYGFVESFNISVAAAISLFCSTLGQVEGTRQVPTVSTQDCSALKARWLQKSVRQSDLILRELAGRAVKQE